MHYGVLGMKWGVRKDGMPQGYQGSPRKQAKAAKKQARAENKAWKKSARSSEMANKVYQDAAKNVQKKIKILNEDPAFKGKDLTKDKRAARQYQTALNALLNRELAQSSLRLNANKAGDRAYVWMLDRSRGVLVATEYRKKNVKIKHADEDLPEFKVKFDEKGFIVNIGELIKSIEHEMSSVDYGRHILEHMGIEI